MSDCSTNAFKPPQGAPREPFDVCELKACFYGEHKPWTYPLALNGRVIKELYVGGVEYAPVRECEQVLADCDDGLQPPFTARCGRCGKEWGFTPKFCPECGAKVVGTRDERKAVKR